MSALTPVSFIQTDIDAVAEHVGRVAVFVDAEGKLDLAARRVNRLTKGAVARLVESERWGKMKDGDHVALGYPAGMKADAVDVIRLERNAKGMVARKAGAALAKARGGQADMLLLAASLRHAQEVVFGFAMRDYAFETHKTAESTRTGALAVMHGKPDDLKAAAASLLAVAEGAHFTRDLTNEPANVLTTTNYAERLKEMESLGLKVEVLDEAALEKLGMRTLLSVGQGSDSPSYVVTIRWDGGTAGAAPLALVGKGVVFDTGGLSLKPTPNSMDMMKCDMGGAAVVAGVFEAVAKLKWPLWIIGLVPSTDNRPGENATCPGDVITMFDGTTVEVLNTDAEGRLILGDALSFAKKFDPQLVIDYATLTGAAARAFGSYGSALMSQAPDSVVKSLKKAGDAVFERVAEMPLWEEYYEEIKGGIADIKNLGKGEGGAQSAAMFLRHFTQYPWVHIDIAGTAFLTSPSHYIPKGGTGVGVRLTLEFLRQQING